jgi:hypothetical protein
MRKGTGKFRQGPLHVRHALLLAGCALLPLQGHAQPAPSTRQPVPAAASHVSLDLGLDFGVGYTDNLFATRNYEISDQFLVIRPTAELTSVKGDDRTTIRAEGELGRYSKHKSENYNDWLIGADTRLRASKGIVLLGGADYRWGHEPRESPEEQNGSRPTRYQLLHGFAGAVLGSGPFTVRPAVIVNRYDFKDVPADGTIINNDDRDRTEVELGLRLLQQVSDGTQLFVQGDRNTREYRQRLDDFGFRRQSTGASFDAGIRRVFSPELSAEAFAGYLEQNYRDPRLKDVRAPDFGAVLDWNGPGGLGVNFRLDRSVEETTLPGASSYLLTNGRLTFKASPDPRLETGLTLGGTIYDYQGDPRTEFVTSAAFWARHWLSRNIYAQIDYSLAKRISNAAGFDFDENRFLFRIGAQLNPHYAGATRALRFGTVAPAGAYVGLFAGHGALVTALDGPRGQGSNTADFGGMGFGYGAFAGYGSTIGNAYFGGELEGSLAGPDWLHVAERVFSVDKADSIGLAARAGWLTPARNLVYGRIGVSRTSLRTSYDLFDFHYDQKKWRTGLDFGVGAEAATAGRGFVRAEYVLTSYNDQNVSSGKGDDNFSSSEGQFRLGVGLRFGGPAPRKLSSATQFAGPYAGVQVGHGSLVSRNLGVREKSQNVDISRGGQGPLLGVFAGYGFEWKSLYAGLEAEADDSKIDWNIERDPNKRIYSARRQWSVGGTLRAGWLISRSALLYGRLGAARTQFVIPYATANQSVVSKRTLTGLRAGGGLEIGLGPRDRLRVDYTVSRYGWYSVRYGQNADQFRHSVDLVRLGLAHAF